MSDCTARRRDGSPCTVRARLGKPFCPFHDPDLQEQRTAGQRTGGEHKRTSHRIEKLTPASLRLILESLYRALEGVESGVLTPQQATAMSSVAGAIAKIHEATDLELRLKALEERREQFG